MKCQKHNLNDEEFRRLTGVKKTTFNKMIEILVIADNKKKAKGGRKNKLTIENQLFMTLEYLREYRTYFHMANNYGVSESTAYKTIDLFPNSLLLIKCKLHVKRRTAVYSIYMRIRDKGNAAVCIRSRVSKEV